MKGSMALLFTLLSVLAAACQGPDRREAPAANGASRYSFDPDHGGLRLPDGFQAFVVADNLGYGRHLAVNSTGDIYLALRVPTQGHSMVALRDSDGDGRADQRQGFGGDSGGTGIDLHQGYLYFASDSEIRRYRLQPGELVPLQAAETVVSGFPVQESHSVKPFTFDDQGWMYVNVGAPSNACQQEARTPGVPGIDPCPQLERQAGIWRFKADQLGQTQVEDGHRFATGIRNAVAIFWNPLNGLLYAAQHGRDQLAQLWPDRFTTEQSAELPAEELLLVRSGSNFGWPYAYYDHLQGKRVLAPEYGGDGTRVGRAAQYDEPLLGFPGHWAPNDLLFYTSDQFPGRYRGGAFIAFHGSWNRAPLPQQGYKVVFVPFQGEQPSGEWEVFADGFAGIDPIEDRASARHRPTGLAQGPDGSLFVSDSVQGRIWRIMYTGS